MSYALAVPILQRLEPRKYNMLSRPKHWKHRVLYVGRDHLLTSFLKAALEPLDCYVVRSPSGRLSYCLIESEIPYIGGSAIKYSLFLFDEQLPDMTGKELAKFTRSVWHRKCTPILIVEKSDDWELLASSIKRMLGWGHDSFARGIKSLA